MTGNKSDSDDISLSSLSSFEDNHDNKNKKEQLKLLLKRKLKKEMNKRLNVTNRATETMVTEHTTTNNVVIQNNEEEEMDVNDNESQKVETLKSKVIGVPSTLEMQVDHNDMESGGMIATNEMMATNEKERTKDDMSPTSDKNYNIVLNRLTHQREFGALVSMKTVIRQSPRIKNKEDDMLANIYNQNSTPIKPSGDIFEDGDGISKEDNETSDDGNGDDYSFRMATDTHDTSSEEEIQINKKRQKAHNNTNKRNNNNNNYNKQMRNNKDVQSGKLKLNDNSNIKSNKLNKSQWIYSTDNNIEVPDEDWFEVLPDGYIEIPKDFVPTERILDDHIRNMVKKLGKSVDKTNLSICERKINTLQKLLKSVGRLQIERIIQKKCSELNLVYGEEKRKVKNLQDLKILFKSDASLDNCVMIWNIMIGQFEDGISLLKNLETNILEQKKWRYGTTESDLNCRSGFVEKILLQQRRQKIRLLNNAALTTHGRIIMLSRPTNMINEQNRFTKRKKGYCDTSYMIGDLDNDFDTQNVFDKDETKGTKKKKTNNQELDTVGDDNCNNNTSFVSKSSNDINISNYAQKPIHESKRTTSFFDYYNKEKLNNTQESPNGSETSQNETPKKSNKPQFNKEDDRLTTTNEQEVGKKNYKLDPNESDNFDAEDENFSGQNSFESSVIADRKYRSPIKENKKLKNKNLMYKKQIKEMKDKLNEQAKYKKQFEILQEQQQSKTKLQQLEISSKKGSEKLKLTDNILHKKNKKQKLDTTNNEFVTKSKKDSEKQILENELEMGNTNIAGYDDVQATKSLINSTELNPKNNTTEWEIEADTNVPFVEFISPTTDDNSTIMELINVRRKKKESCEILILWSCGSYEWASIDNVWKDNKEVIKNYKMNHAKDFIENYMQSKKRGRKPKHFISPTK